MQWVMTDGLFYQLKGCQVYFIFTDFFFQKNLIFMTNSVDPDQLPLFAEVPFIGIST